MSFLFFGAFAIGATMIEVELSIESRVKVFRIYSRMMNYVG
jgi:tetrahydrodipicolinate N-succinyltransferase